MEVNGKSAWNGFNLGLGSDQVALKSQAEPNVEWYFWFTNVLNVADIAFE